MTHPTQHLDLDELERLLEEDGKIGMALSYRLIDRIRELESALGECQKTLNILIDPANQGSGINNMTAWASCVAAECRARAALNEGPTQ